MGKTSKVNSVLFSYFIHMYETQRYWVQSLYKKQNKNILKKINSMKDMVNACVFTSKDSLWNVL